MNNNSRPSLFQALIRVLFLILLLLLNVYFFGDDTLSGSNQIALLLSAGIAGIIAIRQGKNWISIRNQIISSISTAMPAMLILLLIGSLAGTWLISGVVPALILYGLEKLNAKIFLLAAVIICALVSVAPGSSWSTIATIGIALLGIGKALGMPEPVVAGAIISGAYFGDKVSPLSDTTNLAPAMAGTDLFTHIRYMFYTTIPSLVITLVIFTIMGFSGSHALYPSDVDEVARSISTTFHITPWLLLVPVLLIIIILKKVPPIPSLLIGTLLGGAFSIIFQPQIISGISENLNNYAEQSYVTVMKSIFGEINIHSENKIVDELLHTSGMAGMLNTIWLILSAMVFGGVMESGGLLKRITISIISLTRSTGSLVLSTVVSCIFFNVTASDQYLAIVVPGRMYSDTYDKHKLKPEVLSRTLEDAGTMTSVLVPWNTCGATQSRVLGVSTFSYLPYCFFNLISPVMTVMMAYLNIKIRRKG